MSGPVPKRYSRVTMVEGTRANGNMQLRVWGRSRADKTNTVTLEIPFDEWPYIAERVHKLWIDERAARAQRISSINSVFPNT